MKSERYATAIGDGGATVTVIPRMRFLNHKTVESEGSQQGVFYMTADGSTGRGREGAVVMPTDGA